MTDLGLGLFGEGGGEEEGVGGESLFDPEGTGYDYATAKKFNITPDETGHYPSRSPDGQILKGRGHETFSKTEAGEKQAGFEIFKGEDNKYYSKKIGETQPLALDTFSQPEGPLPLDLFGTQQTQETGRSNVEPTVDQPETDDKDFDFVDPFIKTPIALGFGMASWPFAQAARFGAIGGQKIQQNIKFKGKPIVPEMSDEEITDLGNQTAEWFSTLGGNLDPKSDIGKSAMSLAGQAVEPLTRAAHWINSGIDREKYPHLGPLADTATEGMMFAFLGKFTKESIDIGKRQLKVRKKKGQAKIREQKKLEKKQTEVLVKAEKAAKEGKLQETITEYQEAIIPIVKEQTAGQRPSGQKIRTVAERAQAEILARQEASPEQQPSRVAREAERFQEGISPDRRSLSEQSQRAGVEGEVIKPNLRGESQSGTEQLIQPELAPKPEITFVTDEGLPGTTFQIENGKIKEVGRVGEKTTVHQVDPETGKVKLVEETPGERSIYQIMLDPLRNESGAITIPKSAKQMREQTSQSFRENVRRFEKLAKESGKTLELFLKDNDFSKKEIKQMKAVTKMVKQEKPFKATESFDSIAAGKDPLKLQSGERNINLDKNANPKTQIGDKFFEGIKKTIETKLPSAAKAFVPSLHAIKSMKSPQMLDMWHKVKAIENNRIKDNKVLKETVFDLRDQYPNKKLREEAFVKIMSQDNLGKEALKMMEIEPINGPIKYEGLVGELEVQFKDMFTQLNIMRSSIGKRKIAERKSYLPMIAQENFYSNMRKMFKGEKGEVKNPNLVLDSVDGINQRHSPGTVEATNLRHLKRRGLRKGVKLETDPLKLLSQYGSTAYKHIHYSPFNMFVNQLTSNKFKARNSKGKEFDWQMKTQKPELHEFMSRWSNSLAGMPNVVHGPSMRFVESGVQKLSKNLTAAVLGWSIRTIAVQPTAMLPTMTEFGVTPTVKALVRTATRSGKDPITLSKELPNRIGDAFINDVVSNKLHGPVGRVLRLPSEKALSVMQFVDYVAAEATWRTAFESSKHLGKEAAARLGDEAVVRTQGSGFVGDLSPIQMNALGKAVTLWQTYTINHMNWIAKEVLNVKHPERSPAETARRVLTYTVATAMINNIFEEQMGIQSPQPAPIKEMIKAMKKGDSNAAVIYQGLKETTELVPMMSSLKFGSSPAGAVAEFLKELSTAAADDLPRALNGDKKAMKRVGFVAAKLTGVPGTQQIKRLDAGTPLGFPVKEAAGKKRKRGKRKRKSRRRTR